LYYDQIVSSSKKALTIMTGLKDPENKVSFAETAMRLGGKSEEEALKTGAVDTADDQVENLFAPQYKTSNSPVQLCGAIKYLLTFLRLLNRKQARLNCQS
jgi:hypothetical protein